jgi:lysophospholipase L1-like esterase
MKQAVERAIEQMNRTRFGIFVLLLIAAASFFFWYQRDTHTRARQFVIRSTLDRFSDPIVVLGDSIVEASTLPRSLCGHAIINAGISGASTTSDLGTMLEKSLGGKRAAMIVVSLGTNDAALSRSKQTFRTNYTALLKQISTLAPRSVVMAIPPVEDQAAISTTINDFNSILPDIAKEAGATFAALPPMPGRHTFDGVHLNAAGYETWDKAILQEAATICDSK